MKNTYADVNDLSACLYELLGPLEILSGLSLNSDEWKLSFRMDTMEYRQLDKCKLHERYIMPALRTIATRMGTNKRWRPGVFPPIVPSSSADRRTFTESLPIEYTVSFTDSRILQPDKSYYVFQIKVFAQEIPPLSDKHLHQLYAVLPGAALSTHALQILIDRWEEIRTDVHCDVDVDDTLCKCIHPDCDGLCRTRVAFTNYAYCHVCWRRILKLGGHGNVSD